MDIIDVIRKAPQGASAGDIEKAMGGVSRSTINRLLVDAVNKGLIKPKGQGAARVYVDADPLSPIKLFFETPSDRRPVALFQECRLDFTPGLDISGVDTSNLPSLDKKSFVQFLIDFSCASSVLEGGTYSLLDTQALIEYGEKAEGKPLHDAFLVLNHKNAFEYLYGHLNDFEIKKVHAFLTDSHGVPQLDNAHHFLEKHQQGVVRNYEGGDVKIGMSAYIPPLRPGTGYVERMLNKILQTASEIEDPLESAFYLLTRLPYLQPFADGNKRTSRVMCNVPLLKAGLPPISFLDFGKKDYLLSMLAFYELGDTSMAAAMFKSAYSRSCERLGVSVRFGEQLSQAPQVEDDVVGRIPSP